MQSFAEHPGIEHLAQQSAAGFPADRVRADHVLLGAGHLVVRYQFVAQLREFGEETGARDAFLFGRRRDVGEKHPGQSFLAHRRLHGVGERLLVAQLVEKTAAEPARDGRDEIRAEAGIVITRRRWKSQRNRRLRLVARLGGNLHALGPTRLSNLWRLF